MGFSLNQVDRFLDEVDYLLKDKVDPYVTYCNTILDRVFGPDPGGWFSGDDPITPFPVATDVEWAQELLRRAILEENPELDPIEVHWDSTTYAIEHDEPCDCSCHATNSTRSTGVFYDEDSDRGEGGWCCPCWTHLPPLSGTREAWENCMYSASDDRGWESPCANCGFDYEDHDPAGQNWEFTGSLSDMA